MSGDWLRSPGFWLNLLLCLIPVAVAAQVLEWPALVVFVASGLAIVPLARWIGDATEELALHVGPSVGGLLNATFGNATELIIAVFALRAGLVEVVKASITGSVIGNLLFVLGFAMLLGGWGRVKQHFSRDAAGVGASQLTLTMAGLLIPAIFAATLTTPDAALRVQLQHDVSLAVAGLLILSYALGLVFSLRTHRQLFFVPQSESDREPRRSVPKAVAVLVGATVGVAVMSELLVDSLDAAVMGLGWNRLFVGVIVIPILGNAAEHVAAVSAALRDDMDLSLSIALSSSTQIALLVAPLLVFLSYAFGRPMDLLFSPLELAVIVLTALGVNPIARDGESTWYRGAQLLIGYAIVGVAFFFHA